MWLKSFIALKGDEMCDKFFDHGRGWWNVWSKGFIILAGHEEKFINPEWNVFWKSIFTLKGDQMCD